MRKWLQTRYWKPTRAAHFEHVSKERIAVVVGDSVSQQAASELRSMKKGDAAAAAELRMTETGWLPEVLSNREVPKQVTYGHWEDNGDDDADEDTGPEAEADAISEQPDEDEHREAEAA